MVAKNFLGGRLLYGLGNGGTDGLFNGTEMVFCMVKKW
jgi:hypothetical protein